ncbi:unnamed protein product [Arctogadus glacialis]
MYVSTYIDNYEVSNKGQRTGRVSVRATCHSPELYRDRATLAQAKNYGVKPGRVSDMVVMSTKPKQRNVANGVRSTLYKAVSSEQ